MKPVTIESVMAVYEAEKANLQAEIDRLTQQHVLGCEPRIATLEAALRDIWQMTGVARWGNEAEMAMMAVNVSERARAALASQDGDGRGT